MSVRVVRSEIIEVSDQVLAGESHDTLKLLQLVDRTYHGIYDKSHLRYSLKISSPVLLLFVPLYALVLLTVFLYQYVLPVSATEKPNLTVSLVALALALGALGIATVEVLKERIAERLEDTFFSKATGYAPSETPLMKGLIRMRLKSRTVDLYDIYVLNPALFELDAILEKLTR